MPSIPQYDSSPSLPSSGIVSRRISGFDFGSQVGGALAGAGENVAQGVQLIRQKEERDALVHVEKTVAESRTYWARRMSEIEQSAEPGADGFVDSFSEEYQKWKEKVVPTAKTLNAQKALDADLERMRAGLTEKAVTFEVGERARFNVEQVKQTIDDGINAVMTSPDQLSEVLVQQDRVINNMTGLTDIHKSQLKTETAERTKMAAVHGELQIAELRGDYDGTLKILDSMKTGNLKNELSSEKYNTLFNEAVSSSERTLQQELALLRRAEARMEKQDKERKEATAIEGLTLAGKGELTFDWVVSKSQQLSPDDFKYLMNFSTGRIDVKPDVNVYSALRDAAGRGIDVRGAAKEALLSKQINVENYNNVLSRVEAESVPGQLPNWFKSGEDFITRATKPSDINPDVARAQVYARAMDEWQEWARNNLGSSRDEALKVYQQIAKDAAVINYDKITIALPRPTFMTGSRATPDFSETIRRTKEAFDRGDMDQTRYKQQMRLIKQWKDAVENKEQVTE